MDPPMTHLASPARTWGRSAPDVMPPAGNSTNCSTEPADPPWIGISEGVGPCQPARPGKSAPEGPRGVRALDRGRALPGRRGQGGAPGAERGRTTLTLSPGDAGWDQKLGRGWSPGSGGFSAPGFPQTVRWSRLGCSGISSPVGMVRSGHGGLGSSTFSSRHRGGAAAPHGQSGALSPGARRSR